MSAWLTGVAVWLVLAAGTAVGLGRLLRRAGELAERAGEYWDDEDAGLSIMAPP